MWHVEILGFYTRQENLEQPIWKTLNTGIGKLWIKEILQRQGYIEESKQWSKKKTNIQNRYTEQKEN